MEGSISKAVLASHAAARIDPDVLKVRLKIPPVLIPEVVPSRPQLLLLEPPSLSLFHKRANSMYYVALFNDNPHSFMFFARWYGFIL